jgi:hypothetical protein
MVSLNKLVEQLVKVFDSYELMEDYNRDDVIYICFGWDGEVMSPASRGAYLETFGADILNAAEDIAKERVQAQQEQRNNSHYARYSRLAEMWYNNGCTTPKEGEYITLINSGLKGEGGLTGELGSISEYGYHSALCRVERVINLEHLPSYEELVNFIQLYNIVGGSQSDDIPDNLHMWDLTPEQVKTFFQCVTVIVAGGQWFAIDPQGYDYPRYIYVSPKYKEMFNLCTAE